MQGETGKQGPMGPAGLQGIQVSDMQCVFAATLYKPEHNDNN